MIARRHDMVTEPSLVAIAEAVGLTIVGAVAWVLVASGAALVGAGLLARLVSRFGRRLLPTAGRDEAGSTILRLYLFLWLLAIAVWATVFGLLLTPPR
jgi:hypothetical protein